VKNTVCSLTRNGTNLSRVRVARQRLLQKKSSAGKALRRRDPCHDDFVTEK
jgi:hypothetical protein